MHVLSARALLLAVGVAAMAAVDAAAALNVSAGLRITDFSWAGGAYVAVGSRAASPQQLEIWASRDLKTFTKRWPTGAPSPAMRDAPYRIAFNFAKGGFVTLPNDGKTLHSADGDAWKEYDFGVLADSLAFGNGVLLSMFSQLPTKVWCSRTENGTNWTSQRVSGDDPVESVAFANGKFIAFGPASKALHFAADGVVWTPVAFDPGFAHTTVHSVSGNGVRVLIAAIDHTVMLSPDEGLSWHYRFDVKGVPHPAFDAQHRHWMLLDAGDGALYHSADGTKWSATGAKLPGADRMLFSQDRFVALNTPGVGQVQVSTDGGISWL